MVHFHPEPWLKFYNLYSPPGAASDGTVFLHEMRKPNGDTRLVAVDVLIGKTTIDPLCASSTRVFKPATLFHPPEETNSHYNEQTFQFPLRGHGNCQVYFGAVDPSEPTHFTIRAIVDNQPVFYDGWLQNDESVIYSERKSRADEK